MKTGHFESKNQQNALLASLLFGNLVIGTGVMVVPGTLNELAASLQVGIAQAGQLITVGAITVCLTAPLLAAVVARFDRRWLLTACMLWYALLHAACALAPGYTSLLLLRILTVISAAIFTPQAAAVVGQLVAPERRGQAITTVFLGWSLSAVLGSPMAAWVAGHEGWPAAFWIVAALSIFSAYFVYRCVPPQIKVPALPVGLWQQILRSRVLMTTIAVTAIYSTGLFTFFAYLAPYVAQQLRGTTSDITWVFAVYGVCAVLGNVVLTRVIDRTGAARTVMLSLSLIAISMLICQYASTAFVFALLMIPCGLGSFSCNSAQQARLVALAPAFASVSVALNTSALYLGQGLGSAIGGWMIVHKGMAHLHWAALLGILLAMICSAAAAVLAQRQSHAR